MPKYGLNTWLFYLENFVRILCDYLKISILVFNDFNSIFTIGDIIPKYIEMESNVFFDLEMIIRNIMKLKPKEEDKKDEPS